MTRDEALKIVAAINWGTSGPENILDVFEALGFIEFSPPPPYDFHDVEKPIDYAANWPVIW